MDTLDDNQVRQQIREIFYKIKGYYPTDNQLAQFVRDEVFPILELFNQSKKDQ